MELSILQAMTLVAHGNAFLQKDYDISDYYPNNGTFIFINKFIFVELKPNTSEFPIIANDPVEWLKQLKNGGCKLLRLFYASTEVAKLGNSVVNNRMLAGLVGGGGDWWIETIFADYSNQWSLKEEVTDKDAPDRKIWTFTYGSSLERFTVPEVDFNTFEVAKQNLNKTLTDIKQFSATQKLDNWTKLFDLALNILNGKDINLDNFKKYFPSGFFTQQFFQLAGAADAAWVFGGMGSWNDLVFNNPEDQAEYTKLSDKLYQVVILSILYAINSTDMKLV